MKLEYIDRFSKNLRISISWKSVRSKPSCSKRTGRYDEASSRFSRFYEGT